MKIILYSHGGAGNHGCEALVRSTAKVIKSSVNKDYKVSLFSYQAGEDEHYNVGEVVDSITNLPKYKRGTSQYYMNALLYKLGFKNIFTQLRHQRLFQAVRKGDVCVSVGGDNYTYDGWPEVLAYVNTQLKKRGAKTVFWGCSISKELVKDKTFLNDMHSFDLITVREPISYQLFQDAGIKDNVVLVSDPAFELNVVDYDIKQHFNNNNPIVGINLSPLVMSCETSNNATLDNYQTLVNYILDKTDYNVLFVPHVVWSGNDDRVAIKLLYDGLVKTGVSKTNGRVACLPDMDCTRLKGAIGHCKFFIGARTHATIAAYSQNVPTLVVGYSIKAKGIAESLFGTYKDYVLPVQELKQKEDLTKAFLWLESNERSIIETLNKKIPEYKKGCYNGIERLRNIIGD